jgi:sulfur carrier protein ThiS
MGNTALCIEVHLIGFGKDRPACFNEINRFSFHVDQPTTPLQLLTKAGFPDPRGLILMIEDTVIAEDRWKEPIISNGNQVTLMSAIEGG